MAVFNNSGRFGKNADIPPDNVSLPSGKNSGILSEILSGNNTDSDKLLILALMFLLIKDGADMKLILALGYILL